MDLSTIINKSLIRVGQKTLFISFLILVTIIIGYFFRSNYLIEVPLAGGTYTESIVGPPRYINPILAFSQTDKDITRLVYSSLVQPDGNGGSKNVLAQSITISEDGKEYVVTLRDDVVFHDGEKITSDDVVFTIESLQDPIIQSPLRPQWQGVVVEKIDETQVQFTLDQVYPQFVTLLDVGIVPEHIWSDVTPEELPFNTRNIHPVGSGPYSIVDVQRNEREEITQYILKSFTNSLYQPYIENIHIRITRSEQEQADSINSKRVDGAIGLQRTSISQDVIDDMTIRAYSLPRVFALFYKQQENTPLANIEVRQAIDLAINKESLIQNIFSGYGKTLNGPLPPTSPYASTADSQYDKETVISEARSILSSKSWKYDEEENVWNKTISEQSATTSFTLITPETDELVRVANSLKNDLTEIGIKVTVSPLPTDELIQKVIRPRAYELLLFGYVTDIPANIYSFFHSSGRIDPGLNFAEYVNIGVDRSLETIRSSNDPEEIAEEYASIRQEFEQDIPATFLFTQDLLYIQDESVRQLTPLSLIEYPEDRFNNIDQWYVRTERVLPFFAH